MSAAFTNKIDSPNGLNEYLILTEFCPGWYLLHNVLYIIGKIYYYFVQEVILLTY